MRGDITLLPQYAIMAWCSVKAYGQLYLYLYLYIYLYLYLYLYHSPQVVHFFTVTPVTVHWLLTIKPTDFFINCSVNGQGLSTGLHTSLVFKGPEFNAKRELQLISITWIKWSSPTLWCAYSGLEIKTYYCSVSDSVSPQESVLTEVFHCAEVIPVLSREVFQLSLHVLSYVTIAIHWVVFFFVSNVLYCRG
jgi:hypothetical protein